MFPINKSDHLKKLMDLKRTNYDLIHAQIHADHYQLTHQQTHQLTNSHTKQIQQPLAWLNNAKIYKNDGEGHNLIQSAVKKL